MVLRCCVWINSRIRVSKQGVTNNIIISPGNLLSLSSIWAMYQTMNTASNQCGQTNKARPVGHWPDAIIQYLPMVWILASFNFISIPVRSTMSSFVRHQVSTDVLLHPYQTCIENYTKYVSHKFDYTWSMRIILGVLQDWRFCIGYFVSVCIKFHRHTTCFPLVSPMTYSGKQHRSGMGLFIVVEQTSILTTCMSLPAGANPCDLIPQQQCPV